MEKRIIKNLIIEKQEEIPAVSLVKRPQCLESATGYMFVGMRRAGKSYLLYQHIQELIKSGAIVKENILYVNFEDERIASMNAENMGLFLDSYKEMNGVRPWLFLDEIQNMAGWEKFVRSLVDLKYKVYLTGNNAKMLKEELHTALGCRFVTKEVFPFSFKEYLSFHKIIVKRKIENVDMREQVIKLFNDYFYYGGFAESFAFHDKRNRINLLYQKVLLSDIISVNGIKNENAVRILIRKLAESVTQPSSAAKIKNMINSSGISLTRSILGDYIRFLEDAYLIFDVSNFYDKLNGKEILKKRYFWDNGLLNNFLVEPEARLLENIVAIALKKKYRTDLYCYYTDMEVDFYMPEEHRAVQVSYSISDTSVRQKKVKALVKLSEMYSPDRLEIVTWNEKKVIREEGLIVRAIPVWKWLLDI
jgi:predicted AAA+ superfamily ATPase